MSKHTQNALRTSEVRQLQEMIDNTFASALAEVWEKAIGIVKGGFPNNAYAYTAVVVAELERQRDAALSVQKENEDEG